MGPTFQPPYFFYNERFKMTTVTQEDINAVLSFMNHVARPVRRGEIARALKITRGRADSIINNINNIAEDDDGYLSIVDLGRH